MTLPAATRRRRFTISRRGATCSNPLRTSRRFERRAQRDRGKQFSRTGAGGRDQRRGVPGDGVQPLLGRPIIEADEQPSAGHPSAFPLHHPGGVGESEITSTNQMRKSARLTSDESGSPRKTFGSCHLRMGFLKRARRGVDRHGATSASPANRADDARRIAADAVDHRRRY